MSAQYNIVLLGKTGVGKSSLINYLFGQDICRTGVGQPVTGVGVQRVPVSIDDLPVCLLDSWGMEAAHADAWLAWIDEELRRHTADLPFEQWFHTIFYCINAGTHRVEDFDIQVIRKFLAAQYAVIVVFTKADMVSAEDYQALHERLTSAIGDELPHVAVCSTATARLSGEQIQPFGKTDLQRAILDAFWRAIVLRVPDRCIAVINQVLDAEVQQMRDHLKHAMSFPELLVATKRIEKQSRQLIKRLNTEGFLQALVGHEIEVILAAYREFAEKLGMAPQQIEVSDFGQVFPHIDFLTIAYVIANILGHLVFWPFMWAIKETNGDMLAIDVDNYARTLKKQVLTYKPAIAAALTQLVTATTNIPLLTQSE